VFITNYSQAIRPNVLYLCVPLAVACKQHRRTLWQHPVLKRRFRQRSLPCQCREILLRLGKTENVQIRSLQRDRFLADRVVRLMRIPAISVLRFVAVGFNIANRTNYGRVE